MKQFTRRKFFGALALLGTAFKVFAGRGDEEFKGFKRDLAEFQELAKKAEKKGIPSTELKDLKNGYASTQSSYNRLLLAALVKANYVRILKDTRFEPRCVITWQPPLNIVFGNIEDQVKAICMEADRDFDKIITDEDSWSYLEQTIKDYGTG